MLPSKIKEKAEIVINKLKELSGNSEQLQILIAENMDPYSEAGDYYIEPYSFIIDTGGLIANTVLLNDFRDFLRDSLQDTGIEVYSKNYLTDATAENIDDDLIDDYKHLLATAIDITYLDPNKSWEDQFNDAKKKFETSSKTESSVSSIEQEAQKRKSSETDETDITPTSEARLKSEPESKKSKTSDTGGDSPYREQEEMIRQSFLRIYSNLTQDDVSKIKIVIPPEVIDKISSQRRSPSPSPQRTINSSNITTKGASGAREVY